jgi:hypothetical protein
MELQNPDHTCTSDYSSILRLIEEKTLTINKQLRIEFAVYGSNLLFKVTRGDVVDTWCATFVRTGYCITEYVSFWGLFRLNTFSALAMDTCSDASWTVLHASHRLYTQMNWHPAALHMLFLCCLPIPNCQIERLFN